MRAPPSALISVVLVVVACTAPAPPEPVPIPGRTDRGLPATVVQVIDGDTLEVRFSDGSTDRVRLLGIDTPETVKPDAPVDCFGPEASARTEDLLPADTPVIVQRDREARDRYGRLLLYLWRQQDGLFVNASLLADGYARTLSIEPNSTHRSYLSAESAAARAAGTGLWGACPEDG